MVVSFSLFFAKLLSLVIIVLSTFLFFGLFFLSFWITLFKLFHVCSMLLVFHFLQTSPMFALFVSYFPYYIHIHILYIYWNYKRKKTLNFPKRMVLDIYNNNQICTSKSFGPIALDTLWKILCKNSFVQI